MKRFLAPILLMVFLFPSLALGVEFGDLVQRGGLYYERFTNIPFSGKVTGLSQGSFKDGMKDGPFVSYFSSGQLWKKVTYKDGVRDGPYVSYWTNEQLMFEGIFKDGQEDGPWVVYWDNGQLWGKGTYKDGVKVE